MAVIGRTESDNLLATYAHPAAVGSVTVAGLAKETTYKRGTVLARGADDKFVIAAGTAGTAAEAIMASDTKIGTADTVAEVFVSGDFFEPALVLAEGYSLSEADRLSLKHAGIYIADGMPPERSLAED